MDFRTVVEHTGLFVDALGIIAILAALLVASWRFAAQGLRAPEGEGYHQFRQDLGRGILLGLEFLVAADIIRTVAVSPTLDDVLVLGLIVLIRTFLSLSLGVELDGRWPWQTRKPDPS